MQHDILRPSVFKCLGDGLVKPGELTFYLCFGLPSIICCFTGSSRTSDDFIDANVQLGLSAAGMVSDTSSNLCT